MFMTQRTHVFLLSLRIIGGNICFSLAKKCDRILALSSPVQIPQILHEILFLISWDWRHCDLFNIQHIKTLCFNFLCSYLISPLPTINDKTLGGKARVLLIFAFFAQRRNLVVMSNLISRVVDWMSVSSLNSYLEILTLNGMVLGGWGLWEVIGYEGGAIMNRISAL